MAQAPSMPFPKPINPGSSLEDMRPTTEIDAPDLSATQRIIPVLTVFRDDEQISVVPLDKRNVRIGRSAENEICLDDNGVSRHHAQVVTVLGESVVEDLDSRNGTFVNSKWIKTRQLAPGDAIVIAGFRLVYQYAADETCDEVGELMRGWRRGFDADNERRCTACGQPLPTAPEPEEPGTILL
jgi:pSer/pThr/pTyr-binding forkhead associated (FHA) protein